MKAWNFWMKARNFRMKPRNFRMKPRNFRMKARNFRMKARNFRMKARNFRMKPRNFWMKARNFRTKVWNFRTKAWNFRTKAWNFPTKPRNFRMKAWNFRMKVQNFRTKAQNFRMKVLEARTSVWDVRTNVLEVRTNIWDVWTKEHGPLEREGGGWAATEVGPSPLCRVPRIAGVSLIQEIARARREDGACPCHSQMGWIPDIWAVLRAGSHGRPVWRCTYPSGRGLGQWGPFGPWRDRVRPRPGPMASWDSGSGGVASLRHRLQAAVPPGWRVGCGMRWRSDVFPTLGCVR